MTRATLCLCLLFSAGASHALPQPRFTLLGAPEDRPAVPAFKAGPKTLPQGVIFDSDSSAVVLEDAFLDRASESDIVYVGEKHDAGAHHRIQRAVLKGMHARHPGMALGLEMLTVDEQGTLDKFLDGSMPESEFAEFWTESWGFDWRLYSPILIYARDKGIPVAALNAPRSIVRNVARGGLESLPPEERSRIPEEISPIADERYLAYVLASLRGHGRMPPEREAKMLQAMQVWNETMGENALAAARAHGKLLVIVGMGHVLYGSGIAESVSRRGSAAQSVVLPYPTDGESLPMSELLRRLRDPELGDDELADHFWLLPAP